MLGFVRPKKKNDTKINNLKTFYREEAATELSVISRFQQSRRVTESYATGHPWKLKLVVKFANQVLREQQQKKDRNTRHLQLKV